MTIVATSSRSGAPRSAYSSVQTVRDRARDTAVILSISASMKIEIECHKQTDPTLASLQVNGSNSINIQVYSLKF